jgi:hypothetical protein
LDKCLAKNFYNALTYSVMRGILILVEKGKLVVTRGHSVLCVFYGITYRGYLWVCGKADASVILYGSAGCPI